MAKRTKVPPKAPARAPDALDAWVTEAPTPLSVAPRWKTITSIVRERASARPSFHDAHLIPLA